MSVAADRMSLMYGGDKQPLEAEGLMKRVVSWRKHIVSTVSDNREMRVELSYLHGKMRMANISSKVGLTRVNKIAPLYSDI